MIDRTIMKWIVFASSDGVSSFLEKNAEFPIIFLRTFFGAAYR